MADEPSNELRKAAAAAGMSPQKFVELSGRTSLAEWEKMRAEERAATEAGGGSGAQE